MSLDEHLRAVERAARDGSLAGAERETAARLLGVDGARFWLVVRAWGGSDEPPHRTSDAVRSMLPDRVCDLFKKVTSVWVTSRPEDVETWRAYWALPVVAVEEALRWTAPFAAFGSPAQVWDRKDGTFLWWLTGVLGRRSPQRFEEGWRTPRDFEALSNIVLDRRFFITPDGGVEETVAPTGGGCDLAIPSEPVADHAAEDRAILDGIRDAAARVKAMPRIGPQP